MPQKFSKNDPDEAKFIAVWEAMLERTFIDLSEYFDKFNSSPALGNALWEAKAVEVWSILEKSFFIKIFDELISSGYNCGTVDSYCRVIYALFGASTEIVIESNPLEVTINVVAEYQNFADWFSRAGDQIFTIDDFALTFRTLLTDIPRSQLLSLMRSITNAGTKVNFNLN